MPLADAVLEENFSQYRYGFPDAIVEGVRNLSVKPEPGDVVTFWADRLHAVKGIKNGTRINSTFFSALKDSEEATILLWS